MQAIIRKRINKRAFMLPPPVDDAFMSNSDKKERVILSVGRFFRHLHNKRHDALIDTFTKNYSKHLKGWKLIIVGGVTDESGKEVVQELKAKSEGYPVEILTDVGFSELVTLYGKASIYWHAAGFGEDLEKHPERAEHFGITTLEAMAAGCVPVVFDGGGQKDIVEENENGFLWNSEEELVNKTRNIIENDSLRKKITKHAMERAKDFSVEKFEERLYEIVSE